jgi:hypothetical protein
MMARSVRLAGNEGLTTLRDDEMTERDNDRVHSQNGIVPLRDTLEATIQHSQATRERARWALHELRARRRHLEQFIDPRGGRKHEAEEPAHDQE